MGTFDIRKNLREIDSTSLVDKVEKELIELFITQKVKMGEAIPKEVELAELLGVSRTVIREALLRLRMIGLIDSKKKRGAILTNPDLLGLLRKGLYPTILTHETLKDLFEMRLVLEVGMADLIFNNLTRENIERLEKVVMGEPKKSDSVIFEIDHEIRFHGILYEMAGNNTLKEFQQLLMPVFNYVHSSGILRNPITIETFTSHQDLVEILKNGTAEQFRNGMSNHLENHYRRLGI